MGIITKPLSQTPPSSDMKVAAPIKKIAANFGINKYSFISGNNLNGCVSDAEFMNSIAKDNGYTATLYKDSAGTINALRTFLTNAANTSVAGDYVLLSQSSHGTHQMIQGKDCNGLVMNDGVIWDFQIKELLMRFKKGVNVIWITDTCFSEENFRFVDQPKGKVKYIEFSKLQVDLPNFISVVKGVTDFACNFIQIASCSLMEVSYDLGKYGLFTKSLMDAYKVQPKASYYKMFSMTEANMAKSGYPQHPKFIPINCNGTLTVKPFLN